LQVALAPSSQSAIRNWKNVGKTANLLWIAVQIHTDVGKENCLSRGELFRLTTLVFGFLDVSNG
jgi:hypothetical protein